MSETSSPGARAPEWEGPAPQDAPRLHVLHREVPAPGRGNTLLVAGACLLALAGTVASAASLLADASVTWQGTALAVATLALAKPKQAASTCAPNRLARSVFNWFFTGSA